ncbi:MAG: insulinase family protein [Rhabdochlamydiaceae bacterium]|nr:insulinase family protein [Candidatus Amphrikana amoebophyrae]
MRLLLSLLTIFISASLISKNYEVIPDENQLKIKTISMQDRKTRKLKLNNGIEVFIISDPQVTKSSAAVLVKAGSWDDPAEYPGTAHYLEHMLFLGTSKYPDEAGYRKFLSDNGGSYNAWTSTCYTVYGASINNNAFAQYIDYLSDFFVDPLLSQSGMEREFKAVDNENTIYTDNDGRRGWRLLQANANPNHPMSRFSVGNSDTLKNIPHHTLRQWFNSHYGANNMVVSMTSTMSLDEMTEIVSNAFSKVPNRKLDKPFPYTLLLSENQKGAKIYQKPIHDIKEISYIWEIPFQEGSLHNLMHLRLLAYTLNMRTPNSLYQNLLNKGWIESVSAHPMRLSSNNLTFVIDVSLTQKGLDNHDEVTKRIYQTLHQYKSKRFPKYLFDEMKQMQTLQYEYAARSENPFMQTMHLTEMMQYEDLSTFPQKTNVIDSFNPHLMKEILDQLTPQSCSVLVVGKMGSNFNFDKKEKYYGIEYKVEPYSKKEIVSLALAPPLESIQLPKRNPFIPNNLELISHNNKVKATIPLLIQINDQGELYYKEDQRFYNPEVVMEIGILAPNINPSVQSKVLTDLYLMALSEELAPLLSYTRSADIGMSITQKDEMLIFTLSGFSDKASEATLAFFKKMKALNISSGDFDRYKQQMGLNYANAMKSPPLSFGFNTLKSIMYNDSYTSEEMLKELESTYFEDINDYSMTLFNKIYLKGYATGNFTKSEAKDLYDKIGATLSSNSLPKSEHSHVELIRLAKHPKQIKLNSPQLGFSTILMIQMGNYKPSKAAVHSILSTALNTAFFDELRTKQQLGYQVGSQGVSIRDELLEYFYVQSSSHRPEDLLTRNEVFIEDWTRDLRKNIPQERFEAIKQSLISELRMPDSNLDEMAAKEFKLTFEHNGEYDRYENLALALEALDYEAFTTQAIKMISLSNGRRLAILVEGIDPSGGQTAHTQSIPEDFNYGLSSVDAMRKESTYSDGAR